MSTEDGSATQPAEFDAFIASQDLPVLTDFWAEWCGPCKMMHPVLQELARDWKGRLKVIKVDTDKKPALAGRFQISAIPTLILFKGGTRSPSRERRNAPGPIETGIGIPPVKILFAFNVSGPGLSRRGEGCKACGLARCIRE